MPAVEQQGLTELAVLWEYAGRDRYDQERVSAPCQIRLKWTKVKRNVRQPDGTSLGVDAEAVVDREIPDRSILWLGKLRDYSAEAVTAANPLMLVVVYKGSKDIRGRDTHHAVSLQKYHGTLPTVV